MARKLNGQWLRTENWRRRGFSQPWQTFSFAVFTVDSTAFTTVFAFIQVWEDSNLPIHPLKERPNVHKCQAETEIQKDFALWLVSSANIGVENNSFGNPHAFLKEQVIYGSATLSEE